MYFYGLTVSVWSVNLYLMRKVCVQHGVLTFVQWNFEDATSGLVSYCLSCIFLFAGETPRCSSPQPNTNLLCSVVKWVDCFKFTDGVWKEQEDRPLNSFKNLRSFINTAVAHNEKVPLGERCVLSSLEDFIDVGLRLQGAFLRVPFSLSHDALA